MSRQETIVLFTRYPLAGKNKTRLIPALGPEGATELHRQMTQSIVTTLQACQRANNFELEICYTGGTLELMQTWLSSCHYFSKQVGDNLGSRMCSALITRHRQGKSVCLMGTDCPDISCRIIEEAFSALAICDLVLGPSHDGGYYLIGCSPSINEEIIPALFSGISWGGPDVLATTQKKIALAGKTCHLLPILHDIDTPEDLQYLGHYSNTQ